MQRTIPPFPSKGEQVVIVQTNDDQLMEVPGEVLERHPDEASTKTVASFADTSPSGIKVLRGTSGFLLRRRLSNESEPQ